MKLRGPFAVAAILSGACAPVVRDGPAAIDGATWMREQMALGAGTVAPANVTLREGVVHLAALGAQRSGAAVRTRETFGHGDFRASLRCAAPRGAVCAFFLYEPDAGDAADEIDIEMIAGTREVWLTSWVGGVRTNHSTVELAFDPAADFHVYEIRRRADSVAFLIDGTALLTFDRDLPARPMALYANAWWPRWLSPSEASGALEVRWIERAVAHGS